MKMKRLLISAVTLLVPALIFSASVSAGTNDTKITFSKINGVYFYLTNTAGEVDTNHVTKFYANGKLSYCLEPMTDITTTTYNSGDWSVSNLSASDKEYIELAGYYATQKDSQSDNYFLAAQELIWNKVNPSVSVKYTTGANGTGNVINLSSYKSEIVSFINNYKKTPYFGTDEISGTIGDTIMVSDVNKVLGDYNIEYNGKHTITKKGNELEIKFTNNAIQNETIKFNKPAVGTTIVYHQGSSQKLATMSISNSYSSTVKLKSEGAKVVVNKIGEQVNYSNASYRYDKINLEGAEFALYANDKIVDSDGNVVYKKNELIGTFTSNSKGIAILENLYYGKYFLIETASASGNMLNTERYYFEITPDDLVDGKVIKTFDYNNILPKGTLEFTKTDLVTGDVIPNTTIQIFTEDDKLIFTGTTDENGKIVITNLPTNQKFYIIEKNPAIGYVLSDEKLYFEITENGEIIKAEMTNKPITGTFEFTKTDFSTGETLPNTTIEIYNDKNELIGTYVTDDNGKVIIENLRFGKYYILEKKAPDGYELNTEKMWFEITEDGVIVKSEMKDNRKNEKTEIITNVPSTGSNKSYVTEGISVLLISIGIGVVAYAYKKKRYAKKDVKTEK